MGSAPSTKGAAPARARSAAPTRAVSSVAEKGLTRLSAAPASNARHGLSLGWRLTSGRRQSFSLGVEATRREAANDNTLAEHEVMLSGELRW